MTSSTSPQPSTSSLLPSSPTTSRSSRRSTRPPGPVSARALIAVVGLFTALVFASRLVTPLLRPTSNGLSRDLRDNHGVDSFALLKALNGTYRVAPDGTVVVHALPPGRARGTLLLLHGCSHSATDFFPRSASCPKCIGLPEEVQLTRHALVRGYAVAAVSSTDRTRCCWRVNASAPQGPDYDRVEAGLAAAGLPVRDLPLIAAGISSGGAFASSLAPRFPVRAVLSIVSGPTCLLRSPQNCPPHAFVHMGEHDIGTAVRVRDAIAQLQRSDVRGIEYSVAPRAVTPEFLRQAVPHWSIAQTTAVVSALLSAGLLDENHHLTKDPRGSAWRKAVGHMSGELNDSFVADKSPLSEELNRAWAKHEITSDFFSEALSFLEKNKAEV